MMVKTEFEKLGTMLNVKCQPVWAGYPSDNIVPNKLPLFLAGSIFDKLGTAGLAAKKG